MAARASRSPTEAPLRDRDRILSSLEGVYREAFDAARQREDDAGMARLDFEFQRDQVWIEVLLDVRDLLAPPSDEDPSTGKQVGSLLEKARAIRRFTGR